MTTSNHDCYHCGELIPSDFQQTVEIDNICRDMCCHGCSAVAQAIVDNQLTGYYRHRTEKGVKAASLVPDELRSLESYDLTEIEQEFTVETGDSKAVILTVENVTCAACAWLIEKKLSTLVGIEQCSVNTSSARLSLKWQSDTLKLSQILLALAQIGYKAYPFKADIAEQNEVASAKAYLRRLTIAGLATMQIMMFAMASYFDVLGDDGTGSLSDGLSDYFRYVSLLLALPVVFYASLPFYQNALSALIAKRLNMDVPVSIAILLAFFASAYATMTNQGDVYFESVCMFAFFLLLGRYLEQSAKRKAAQTSSNLLKLIPSTATLVHGDEFINVPAKTLKRDQVVLVKPGETIPADGTIVSGATQCNESVLTGEQLPVSKTIGDWVFASTINNEQSIKIVVKEERSEQLISKIIALQEQAAIDKPKLATMADKLSQYVVVGILLLAMMTYVGWWLIDSSQALWNALAVLVATCPCALSLATPSAYTAATTKLQRFGLLAKQGKTLDTLTQITHICFDKTGTLTTGDFRVDKVISQLPDDTVLGTIAALESHSNHPIAHAFSSHINTELNAINVKAIQGSGLTGSVNNVSYFLGSYHFVCSQLTKSHHESSWLTANTDNEGIEHGVDIYLSTNESILAKVVLSDELRSGSVQLIQHLKARHITTTLLTGDNSNNAGFIGHSLDVDIIKRGQSPAQKLAYLKALQQEGDVVAMFGDGVNDAPVLSQAHLSFAMGTGADIAKSSADIVLLHDDLEKVFSAINLANKTKRVIIQNFCWSLGYNLTAVPFAIAGYLPPYIAAIGMSLSSIIVVSNSLRLLKEK
jgi:Cu2+-exporting ATPase